jgi:hypothetical protein
MNHLPFRSVLAVASLTSVFAAFGCGSNSTSGNPNDAGSSSSGGSSSGSSSGGSSSSGSSSGGSSSGGPSGPYAYCVPEGDSGIGEICFAFQLSDGGATAATVCAADTENALTWTSVSSCALPGLTGCCSIDNGMTWQCFYDAADAGAASTCTNTGGTWITTNP